LNIILFIDLLALGSLFYALFTVIREKSLGIYAFRTALGLLLTVFLVYTTINLFERAAVGSMLVPFNDYVEILIPIGFLMLFSLSVFSGKESAVAARGRVMNAINAITKMLPVRDDPRLLWKELLARVINTMELDGGFMFLVNGSETIRVNHRWEMPVDIDLLSDDLAIKDTILNKVINTGEPLVLEHTEAVPDQFIQAMHNAGAVSAAFFPLMSETRVLGVMGVVSLTHREFSDVGLDLFQMLGQHLGEIVMNNRLINETQIRSTELSNALHTKKRFLSMISHELRDPLTVIKGALFLLKDELSEGLDEDFGKALEVAVVNSWKLEKLVDEVLDLSKLDAGEIKLAFAPIDPYKELTQLTDEARNSSIQKGVVLDVDLPEDPSPIEVDRYRFHQVIQNLLSNALKYTPEGGKVSIKAREDHNNFVITVSDTGIGIDKEEIGHIFDMFYRTRAAIDTVRGGSGVGLAIAREIVHLHGGEITVDSAPGEGSVFTVTIPRMQLV